MARQITGPDMLTPAEVGQLFRVDPKTVTRWAKEGKLRSIRTLSTGPGRGHRRFYLLEVQALLAGKPLTEAELDALVWGGSDDA